MQNTCLSAENYPVYNEQEKICLKHSLFGVTKENNSFLKIILFSDIFAHFHKCLVCKSNVNTNLLWTWRKISIKYNFCPNLVLVQT